MAQIALTNALSRPIYIIIAAMGFIFSLLIYIYTQLIGGFFRVEQWNLLLKSENSIIPILFSILFGLTIAYQIYLLRQKKCSIKKSVAGAGSSSATIIGLLAVSQCPECATLGFFLLPASLAGYLSGYSLAVDLIAIALLLYTLIYLGAFKKANKEKSPTKKAGKSK